MNATTVNKSFWNWGKGIGLLYLSFVLLIVLMVVKSMQQNVDLVSEDYYAKELTFQSNIDAQSSANLLAEEIEIITKGRSIDVDFGQNFGGKTIEGKAVFLRPSDDTKDIILPIKTNQQHLNIASEKLLQGVYTLTLTFQVDGKPYEVKRDIRLD